MRRVNSIRAGLLPVVLASLLLASLPAMADRFSDAICGDDCPRGGNFLDLIIGIPLIGWVIVTWAVSVIDGKNPLWLFATTFGGAGVLAALNSSRMLGQFIGWVLIGVTCWVAYLTVTHVERQAKKSAISDQPGDVETPAANPHPVNAPPDARSIDQEADYQQAAARYRKAAEQGDADKQYHLGLLYYIGRGVPKDYQQAAAWYSKAAEQGLADPQYLLSSMYSQGQGVPKDEQMAYFWLLLARAQSIRGAAKFPGIAESRLSPAQRRAAEAAARAWKPSSLTKPPANPGTSPKPVVTPAAELHRVNAPADARLTEPDYQQAAARWRKAADQGDADGQNNLGNMYADGQGVPKDDQQAVVWYRKAAEQGLPTAQYNLGNMYRNGEGVPKDDQQAAAWFRKAAEQGEADAQSSLGLMYAMGKGAPKDEQSAYFWWLLASAQGHKGAVTNRDSVKRDLSSDQRDAAEADAHTWKPK